MALPPPRPKKQSKRASDSTTASNTDAANRLARDVWRQPATNPQRQQPQQPYVSMTAAGGQQDHTSGRRPSTISNVTNVRDLGEVVDGGAQGSHGGLVGKACQLYGLESLLAAAHAMGSSVPLLLLPSGTALPLDAVMAGARQPAQLQQPGSSDEGYDDDDGVEDEDDEGGVDVGDGAAMAAGEAVPVESDPGMAKASPKKVSGCLWMFDCVCMCA